MPMDSIEEFIKNNPATVRLYLDNPIWTGGDPPPDYVRSSDPFHNPNPHVSYAELKTKTVRGVTYILKVGNNQPFDTLAAAKLANTIFSEERQLDSTRSHNAKPIPTQSTKASVEETPIPSFESYFAEYQKRARNGLPFPSSSLQDHRSRLHDLKLGKLTPGLAMFFRPVWAPSKKAAKTHHGFVYDVRDPKEQPPAIPARTFGPKESKAAMLPQSHDDAQKILDNYYIPGAQSLRLWLQFGHAKEVMRIRQNLKEKHGVIPPTLDDGVITRTDRRLEELGVGKGQSCDCEALKEKFVHMKHSKSVKAKISAQMQGAIGSPDPVQPKSNYKEVDFWSQPIRHRDVEEHKAIAKVYRGLTAPPPSPTDNEPLVTVRVPEHNEQPRRDVFKKRKRSDPPEPFSFSPAFFDFKAPALQEDIPLKPKPLQVRKTQTPRNNNGQAVAASSTSSPTPIGLKIRDCLQKISALLFETSSPSSSPQLAQELNADMPSTQCAAVRNTCPNYQGDHVEEQSRKDDNHTSPNQKTGTISRQDSSVVAIGPVIAQGSINLSLNELRGLSQINKHRRGESLGIFNKSINVADLFKKSTSSASDDALNELKSAPGDPLNVNFPFLWEEQSAPQGSHTAALSSPSMALEGSEDYLMINGTGTRAVGIATQTAQAATRAATSESSTEQQTYGVADDSEVVAIINALSPAVPTPPNQCGLRSRSPGHRRTSSADPSRGLWLLPVAVLRSNTPTPSLVSPGASTVAANLPYKYHAEDAHGANTQSNESEKAQPTPTCRDCGISNPIAPALFSEDVAPLIPRLTAQPYIHPYLRLFQEQSQANSTTTQASGAPTVATLNITQSTTPVSPRTKIFTHHPTQPAIKAKPLSGAEYATALTTALSTRGISPPRNFPQYIPHPAFFTTEQRETWQYFANASFELGLWLAWRCPDLFNGRIGMVRAKKGVVPTYLPGDRMMFRGCVEVRVVPRPEGRW